MNEVKILLWWIAFAVTHIGGSSVPVRTYLCRRLGVLGFKGVYALVALATFTGLCRAYFIPEHEGSSLFEPAGGMDLVTQALMLVAVVVLVQALATPNPVSSMGEVTGEGGGHARGIQRVTRHPMNTAFAVFGLAHMLSNAAVADWLFFGGFVVFGVLSAVHQDRRTLATRPAQVGRLQSETSLVPFAAILAGRQRLAPGEFNVGALAVSIVVFVALRYFHPTLFGGFGS